MILGSTSVVGEQVLGDRDVKASEVTDEIAFGLEYDDYAAVYERLRQLQSYQLELIQSVTTHYGNVIDPMMLVNEFLASTDRAEIEHNFSMLKLAMQMNPDEIQMYAVCELPQEVRDSGLTFESPMRPEHVALVLRASAGSDEWEESLYECAVDNLGNISGVVSAVSFLRDRGTVVHAGLIEEYLAHPPAMFSGVL